MTNSFVSFSITKSAANKINLLARKEESSRRMLRVSVEAGGCSGFKYKYDFTDKKNEDDIEIHHEGAIILIDNISIGFLENSELDFIEELGGEFFQIKNPNATTKCGCGSSFGV